MNKSETTSNQTHTEGAEDNSLTGWMDVINKHHDDWLTKIRLRNERLDKIIVELEAVDPIWWNDYTEAYMIVRLNEWIKQAADRGEDNISSKNQRQEIKRGIVERIIYPAVAAFIRAGYVKPTEQT